MCYSISSIFQIQPLTIAMFAYNYDYTTICAIISAILYLYYTQSHTDSQKLILAVL